MAIKDSSLVGIPVASDGDQGLAVVTTDVEADEQRSGDEKATDC